MPLILRFHSLIILKKFFISEQWFGGLFNMEISQQEEDMMGSSGFQLWKKKALPLSYCIPPYKNKPTVARRRDAINPTLKVKTEVRKSVCPRAGIWQWAADSLFFSSHHEAFPAHY